MNFCKLKKTWMKMRRNNSKNLIYLCQNKLVAIDAALPVLLEIKSRYPKTNVIFIFYDEKHLDLIKTNYNLWEMVQSMQSSIYVLRARNKFIRLIRSIAFIVRYSFKDIVIVKSTDSFPFHNIFMKILKRVSRVKEIKTYLRLRSIYGYRISYIQKMLSGERRGRPVKFKYLNGNYDCYLSTITAPQFKEFFKLDAPKEKIINTGYIRRLSQWQQYMEQAVKNNKNINDGPYFLYVLTYLGSQDFRGFKQALVGGLFKEALEVFKKYNNKIKTVFKPHAVTDMREVEALLASVGYSNYAIDYTHPMILSAKAKFVFYNIFSTTMYDAYYLNVPVVEYSHYDPEFFDKIGRQSSCGNCCDFFIHHDKKKLEELAEKLIINKVEVRRDPKFIEENFPPPPPEFYEFLDKLFL